MRRAAWRNLPDEPAAIVRWVPKVLGETSSLLLVASFVFAFLAWALDLTVFLGLAVAPVVGALLLPYRSPRPRPDLLTLPLPPDSFPVGVTVRLFRDPTGVDDAVATFVKGWLHIEGARTAFSLRAIDGRFGISMADGALVAELPGGQRVRIAPALFLASASSRPRGDGQTFLKAAEEWIRERAEVPGSPILPPLRTQPHVYARTAVRAVLLLVICLSRFWP